MCNDNAEQLIDGFVNTIHTISLKAESINKNQYKHIIEFQIHMLKKHNRNENHLYQPMEINKKLPKNNMYHIVKLKKNPVKLKK